MVGTAGKRGKTLGAVTTYLRLILCIALALNPELVKIYKRLGFGCLLVR